MNQIPSDYKKRLKEIIEQSWTIFKHQFINGRFEIANEASFQHHFANIIRSVGELFCLKRKDLFLIDLEPKFKKKSGGFKNIDITCGFENVKIKCVIELKLKKKSQGAQDNASVDCYLDLQALEDVSDNETFIGFFFFLTDDKWYTKQSKKGTGTIFNMSEGFKYNKGTPLIAEHKGRKGDKVQLKNDYILNYDKIGNYYFLEIPVE